MPNVIAGGRRRLSWKAALFLILAVLLLGGRFFANYYIEYQWWKELGQVPTWVDMLLYGLAPVVVAAIISFAVLWVTHARAVRFAGSSLRLYPIYALVSTILLLIVAVFAATSTIDTWTVVRYFGGHGLPESA
ncbi:MAG: UPF0182 family protein, partial [Bryobacteraceae bacterium]